MSWKLRAAHDLQRRGLGLVVSADNLGGAGGVAMLLESGIEEAQSSGHLMSADEARVYWMGQPDPARPTSKRQSA